MIVSIHVCSSSRGRRQSSRLGGNGSKRDRRKIVPSEIEGLLAPPTVAAWFMDDGTADRAGVSFQTHSFTFDEVVRLAAALASRYGLKTSLNRNKGAWVVYVHGSSVPDLAAAIGPLLIPEVAYKLGPCGPCTPERVYAAPQPALGRRPTPIPSPIGR